MENHRKDKKENEKIEIMKQIGIAKACLERLRAKRLINVVASVTFSSILAFVILGILFSQSQKEIIAEINFFGSQISLTYNHLSIIALVLTLLTNTLTNRKPLLIDINALNDFYIKAGSYLRDGCPSDDKKGIENRYYAILSIIEEIDHYSYDTNYLHIDKKDIPLHKKRMAAREKFLGIGIILVSLIVVIFSAFGILSFPYLVLLGIPLAYGFVMFDFYYYQILLKKKGIAFNTKQFIDYADFGELDVEDEINCINNILRMLRSRYNDYLTGINITATCFNAVSIVISVLDLTGLDLSFYFQLPFQLNNSYIIITLVIITLILTIIMKLFTERSWVRNIYIIDNIFKDQEIYKNNLRVKHKKFKESIEDIDYLFTDIDKARGRHEFDIDAFEKV